MKRGDLPADPWRHPEDRELFLPGLAADPIDPTIPATNCRLINTVTQPGELLTDQVIPLKRRQL